MSIVNHDNISVIITQSGKNGIPFKNYFLVLKRTKKNENEIWICTHKLCNASIMMHEGLVIKMSSIRSDGSHKFQHQQKMDVNVYECIRSLNRRIDKDPVTPVPLLYDQVVKKFKRENGTTGSVPMFDRVKSSLYKYRSSKHSPALKSLSTIINLLVHSRTASFCSLTIMFHQQILDYLEIMNTGMQIELLELHQDYFTKASVYMFGMSIV